MKFNVYCAVPQLIEEPPSVRLYFYFGRDPMALAQDNKKKNVKHQIDG